MRRWLQVSALVVAIPFASVMRVRIAAVIVVASAATWLAGWLLDVGWLLKAAGKGGGLEREAKCAGR